MKSAKSKRQLTLLTLVVALGVAVYLNWEYAKSDPSLLQPQDLPVSASNSDVPVDAADSTVPVDDTLPVEAQADASLPVQAEGDATAATDAQTDATQDNLPDKNYGDAQLVSAGASSADKYFDQARLTREKTRDAALDKLQKSLKNTGLDKEEKTALTESLTAVIAGITAEGDIENLVKAKGFVDCVAFIDSEKVNVAVKTGGTALEQSQVAQIRDIVLSKLETDAKNITVVEVK